MNNEFLDFKELPFHWRTIFVLPRSFQMWRPVHPWGERLCGYFLLSPGRSDPEGTAPELGNPWRIEKCSLNVCGYNAISKICNNLVEFTLFVKSQKINIGCTWSWHLHVRAAHVGHNRMCRRLHFPSTPLQSNIIKTLITLDYFPHFL